MRHPTDDQLYDLAQKITAEEDFSQEEKAYMRHIADCDECYHMICCLLAMQDITGHIGVFSHEVSSSVFKVPIRNTISAVINLTINSVHSILNQVVDEMNTWTFRKPAIYYSMARGKAGKANIKKLIDPRNSQTFVVYDDKENKLVIQIDSNECENEPKASIVISGGERINVQFEKKENIYWAEVEGLQEGEYEIILEK